MCSKYVSIHLIFLVIYAAVIQIKYFALYVLKTFCFSKDFSQPEIGCKDKSLPSREKQLGSGIQRKESVNQTLFMAQGRWLFSKAKALYSGQMYTL